MKRIKYACLAQTIHFELKEDLEHDEAAALVKQEAAAYKAGLERRNTKYKIEREEVQRDGSIIMQIRKQYNFYPCGSYLD